MPQGSAYYLTDCEPSLTLYSCNKCPLISVAKKRSFSSSLFFFFHLFNQVINPLGKKPCLLCFLCSPNKSKYCTQKAVPTLQSLCVALGMLPQCPWCSRQFSSQVKTPVEKLTSLGIITSQQGGRRGRNPIFSKLGGLEHYNINDFLIIRKWGKS